MILMALFAFVALMICCIYFPAKYHQEEEAVKYFTSMDEKHLPVLYLSPLAYN